MNRIMIACAVIDINLEKMIALVRCRLRLANASYRGHTTINLQEFENNVVCPQLLITCIDADTA